MNREGWQYYAMLCHKGLKHPWALGSTGVLEPISPCIWRASWRAGLWNWTHAVYPPFPFYIVAFSILLLLLRCFSRDQLCTTPQTAAHQAPPSLGFSRQEHWSGLPLPSPMHEREKWKWSRSVMTDSMRPHRLQPTRLLCPWDFPGKSTGVGRHCLLHQYC